MGCFSELEVELDVPSFVDDDDDDDAEHPALTALDASTRSRCSCGSVSSRRSEMDLLEQIFWVDVSVFLVVGADEEVSGLVVVVVVSSEDGVSGFSSCWDFR